MAKYIKRIFNIRESNPKITIVDKIITDITKIESPAIVQNMNKDDIPNSVGDSVCLQSIKVDSENLYGIVNLRVLNTEKNKKWLENHNPKKVRNELWELVGGVS